MTAEKLPSAYIDKYQTPDIFNQEYHKYVTRIKQDLDGNNEGSATFDESARLDFYRVQSKQTGAEERDDPDEAENMGKFSVLTREIDEPSFGSQQSIKNLDQLSSLSSKMG